MATENTGADREWSYLSGRRVNLRVRALSNRLYQQERQRIMERREGLVKVAALVFGSVALSRVVTNRTITDLGLAVIFAGTASSLVFGWGSKARDAAKRASEWAILDKEMEEAGERGFAEEQINQWAGRCSEIESSEPAPNQSLFELCYRRACESLGCAVPQGGVKMPHRLFRFIP